MEVMEFNEQKTTNWCLNPYYNGRYSWSFADGTKALLSEKS